MNPASAHPGVSLSLLNKLYARKIKINTHHLTDLVLVFCILSSLTLIMKLQGAIKISILWERKLRQSSEVISQDPSARKKGEAGAVQTDQEGERTEGGMRVD